MRSVKSIIAGTAALLSTAAFAADMPSIMPPPPPAIPYAAPMQEEFGGWYLRGDVGVGSQSFAKARQRYEDFIAETFSYKDNGFAGISFFGIGAGYQFNSFLRVDVTGEFRGRASLHSKAVGSFGSVDQLTGSMSSWVALANIYADLGTWWCFTPFVGVGIGVANNKIHDLYDASLRVYGAAGSGGIVAYADDAATKMSLAYALHAGVSYKVSNSLSMELAYRYLNLGSASSGFFHNTGTPVYPGPYNFSGIDSHDLKLGMRWTCCEPPPPVQPVLMRRG
jgi:opacity protein-like surface antigen